MFPSSAAPPGPRPARPCRTTWISAIPSAAESGRRPGSWDTLTGLPPEGFPKSLFSASISLTGSENGKERKKYGYGKRNSRNCVKKADIPPPPCGRRCRPERNWSTNTLSPGSPACAFCAFRRNRTFSTPCPFPPLCGPPA